MSSRSSHNDAVESFHPLSDLSFATFESLYDAWVVAGESPDFLVTHSELSACAVIEALVYICWRSEVNGGTGVVNAKAARESFFGKFLYDFRIYAQLLPEYRPEFCPEFVASYAIPEKILFWLLTEEEGRAGRKRPGHQQDGLPGASSVISHDQNVANIPRKNKRRNRGPETYAIVQLPPQLTGAIVHLPDVCPASSSARLLLEKTVSCIGERVAVEWRARKDRKTAFSAVLLYQLLADFCRTGVDLLGLRDMLLERVGQVLVLAGSGAGVIRDADDIAGEGGKTERARGDLLRPGGENAAAGAIAEEKSDSLSLHQELINFRMPYLADVDMFFTSITGDDFTLTAAQVLSGDTEKPDDDDSQRSDDDDDDSQRSDDDDEIVRDLDKLSKIDVRMIQEALARKLYVDRSENVALIQIPHDDCNAEEEFPLDAQGEMQADAEGPSEGETIYSINARSRIQQMKAKANARILYSKGKYMHSLFHQGTPFAQIPRQYLFRYFIRDETDCIKVSSLGECREVADTLLQDRRGVFVSMEGPNLCRDGVAAYLVIYQKGRDRPTRRRGVGGPRPLPSQIWIFDLQAIGAAAAFEEGRLRALLESTSIQKTVFDARAMNDYLHHKCGFFMQNFLETQVATVARFYKRSGHLPGLEKCCRKWGVSIEDPELAKGFKTLQRSVDLGEWEWSRTLRAALKQTVRLVQAITAKFQIEDGWMDHPSGMLTRVCMVRNKVIIESNRAAFGRWMAETDVDVGMLYGVGADIRREAWEDRRRSRSDDIDDDWSPGFRVMDL